MSDIKFGGNCRGYRGDMNAIAKRNNEKPRIVTLREKGKVVAKIINGSVQNENNKSFSIV